MRFELYGQYDIPSRVFGLYGDLALSHLGFASDATASSTAFSSLDVGGYFLPFRTLRPDPPDGPDLAHRPQRDERIRASRTFTRSTNG